jgi:hypothetical protein
MNTTTTVRPPARSFTPPVPTPTVRPHPSGGYTHAWLTIGTARVYSGHFTTQRLARRAARSAVNPWLRAAIAAAQAVELP